MARTRQQLGNPQVRAEVRTQLRDRYEAGSSIRDLANEFGLSFGTVRALLLEAGVCLRSRGGPNHRRRDPDNQ
jgi:hypothetical protein